MTGNNRNPIFQIRDVIKSNSSIIVTLSDVNLDIIPREFLGTTRKSGARVTSLLHMISGVSELTSGEAF